MTFRVTDDEDRRHAYMTEVDDSWTMVPGTLWRISDVVPEGSIRGDVSDPRLFVSAGDVHMTFHDDMNLYLGRITDREYHYKPVELEGIKRKRKERNWLFFQDQTLKCVYQIHPHTILRCEEETTRYRCIATSLRPQPIPWYTKHLGMPHGGTCPVLIDGLWFSFFQSWVSTTMSGQRFYSVGFYAFRPEPPHDIALMTKLPILHGYQFEPPYSFPREFKVVYPSGAIYEKGNWYLSLGIHDRTFDIFILDHQELLKGVIYL